MHPELKSGKVGVKSRSSKFAEELESDYWSEKAQNHLKKILAEDQMHKQRPKKAKNIILFLGDGMSLTTVAATRVHVGGEEVNLSFEDFPHFGLSKVYIELT